MRFLSYNLLFYYFSYLCIEIKLEEERIAWLKNNKKKTRN